MATIYFSINESDAADSLLIVASQDGAEIDGGAASVAAATAAGLRVASATLDLSTATAGAIRLDLIDDAGERLQGRDAWVDTSGDLVAGMVETRDLEQVQHLWQLTRRADGALTAVNPLNVGPGEVVRAGFQCLGSLVLAGSSVLATMTTPTSSDTDAVTVAKLGIAPTVAKVEVTALADAAAGTYYVRTTVTDSTGGGPVTLLGTVIVRAEPT